MVKKSKKLREILLDNQFWVISGRILEEQRKRRKRRKRELN